MKRITRDRIKTSDLQIVSGEWIDYIVSDHGEYEVSGMCPISHVLHQEKGLSYEDIIDFESMSDSYLYPQIAEQLDITEAYIRGFISGVDGFGLGEESQDYIDGYNDGDEIRDEFVALELGE